MNPSSPIGLYQSEAKAEEYGFARPAAQDIDTDSFVFDRIDQEFSSGHAGPESLVTPSGDLFEINRSATQRFGLTVRFIEFAKGFEDKKGAGKVLPFLGGQLNFGFGFSECEFGVVQIVFVRKLFDLLGEHALLHVSLFLFCANPFDFLPDFL